MHWKKIIKRRTPTSGTYKDWKPNLSEEAEYRCVYCCIHENAFGGVNNFHVEHYKPKSKFEELTNEYSNLFYACPLCNVFKGQDWPRDPLEDHSALAYPDPSEVDYSHLFTVEINNFKIQGVFPAGEYVVQRVYLNRPQLILERREEVAQARWDALNKKLKGMRSALESSTIPDNEKNQYLNSIIASKENFEDLIAERREIRPYSPADVRR